MLATVTFHFLIPVPTVDSLVRRHRAELAKLQKETHKLQEEVTVTRAYVRSKLWNAQADNLGAEAMSVVDQAAKKNQIAVQAFRPQRTVVSDGIERFPYSVVVQGSFPRVLQLVRDLQDPGTLLAVTSVQLSSADGASDSVTATVGLAAFLESSEVKTNGK